MFIIKTEDKGRGVVAKQGGLLLFGGGGALLNCTYNVCVRKEIIKKEGGRNEERVNASIEVILIKRLQNFIRFQMFI